MTAGIQCFPASVVEKMVICDGSVPTLTRIRFGPRSRGCSSQVVADVEVMEAELGPQKEDVAILQLRIFSGLHLDNEKVIFGGEVHCSNVGVVTTMFGGPM